jgi:hypothetical protein
MCGWNQLISSCFNRGHYGDKTGSLGRAGGRWDQGGAGWPSPYVEAEAYPHSAVDSGTGQCGAPKGESDAPVAILGADLLHRVGWGRRPPTCIAYLHATLPEHQPPAPGNCLMQSQGKKKEKELPRACTPEVERYLGCSRGLVAMQRYATVDEYDGGGWRENCMQYMSLRFL